MKKNHIKQIFEYHKLETLNNVSSIFKHHTIFVLTIASGGIENQSIYPHLHLLKSRHFRENS